jgi:UDP-glucose 4-epimerase
MKVLVTGGAGSLGSAITRKLLEQKCEVVILSRNEKNQDFLKRDIDNPNLKFMIGDVRNLDRVREAVLGCDTVIHCAALKFVPICQDNTWEAVTTNIIGTKIVLQESVKAGVTTFILISTDKACDPVNVYGNTKSLCENLVAEYSRLYNDKKFVVVRLGNLIKSRGSVYEIFKDQIDKGKPITITDPNMTRFFISLDQAADFVILYDRYYSGTVVVPRMKYAKIGEFADCMIELYGGKKRIIGCKIGEKVDESLISNESFFEYNTYFVIHPYGDLHGNVDVKHSEQMTKEEIKELINGRKEVQSNNASIQDGTVSAACN